MSDDWYSFEFRPPAPCAPSHLQLFGWLDAADLHDGIAPGLVGGYAGAEIVVDVHLQVALDFISQFPLAPFVRPKAGQPAEPRAQRPRAWPSARVRKRCRIAVVCSQLRVSRSSCLRPGRVSRPSR